MQRRSMGSRRGRWVNCASRRAKLAELTLAVTSEKIIVLGQHQEEQ